MGKGAQVVNEFDVIVVGAGAGGMAAAVSAAKNGASVIVIEKDKVLGGTTARSGGVLWIPCHPFSQQSPAEDSIENATTYLRHEAGRYFNAEKVQAFLHNGPRMVDWFQRETDVKFVSVPEFSDYHPDAAGGLPGGRSILAAPFDGRELGKKIEWLRPPLREITFVGMMFNASKEISQFFNVTRSLASAWYVTKRLVTHAREMLTYGRAMRLTNGNALAARLAKSAFDCDIPFRLDTRVERLLMEGRRVAGVAVNSGGESMNLYARTGVILAGGGFPQDVERRKALFPHAPNGTEHLSPAPASNTGDGLRLAANAGAALELDLPNAAAWIPVSKVPYRNGESGVFPHLIDRYKPGVIMVTRNGLRFTNESNSYHDVGMAMQKACRDSDATEAFLICDHRTLRRYGLGFVKPFPIPFGPHLRSGYLKRGRTLAELADAAGIDAAAFERTVATFNEGAVHGEDHQFGRGNSAYNRFLGDAEHQPNPCVAPIQDGPFYAIRTVIGDLGTFAGIRTDGCARALDSSGHVVPGLYAVGNDAASVMGGNYPGGGITLGPAMTFGFLAGEHAAKTARGARENALSLDMPVAEVSVLARSSEQAP
ncbi:pyridine nucleotide-disulfide oxidoreductase family protein [Paraburkholderia xenovorans LB400]|uniref:Dehydrogenase n=1 Tax=Paraburkholderia xenovorans (strain LB400) TaxID=266265 RepID=Q143V7_PARXL|nr:FAD-dependent oxidoreductase [Paraburkholderia xenovorans]ABE29382.1 Putative dehydrogenase [Paraburkholderia xenovorans LB400]AIP31289.1 pyridine nucleotide-disulfide oxidoreductase family protein [Paraburkholderia xenovorans LB400]